MNEKVVVKYQGVPVRFQLDSNMYQIEGCTENARLRLLLTRKVYNKLRPNSILDDTFLSYLLVANVQKRVHVVIG